MIAATPHSQSSYKAVIKQQLNNVNMGKKEKLTNIQNKNNDYINVLFCVLLVMATKRNIFVVVFTHYGAAVFRSRQVFRRSIQAESVNK